MAGSPLSIIAGALVGLGVAAGGYFIGTGYYDAHMGNRVVSVKGLSERNVTADLAFWPIRFVATGNDLTEVQGKIRADAEAIRAFLGKYGFEDAGIELQSLQVTDVAAQPYRSGPIDNRFIISQLLMLRSEEVEKVAEAARSASELVEAGVILSSDMGPSQPIYLFKSLAELKPEMLDEATARAREAAQSFAEDSDSKLGGIKRANQGVFQILARDQAPGISESSQIAKRVRVVSSIDYFLVD
ncbi:SIMPL domain-containing protein [Tepidicaulis sp.]|uniref:SIMPL domain-containing protein n=1 Tax=Tepidicaulis sp. TaxID=1920809 RepID=UPI003B5CEC5E